MEKAINKVSDDDMKKSWEYRIKELESSNALLKAQNEELVEIVATYVDKLKGMDERIAKLENKPA